MEQGVYIFEDAEDFLKFFRWVEQESDSNKPNDVLRICKPLFDKATMEKEIKFLNKCWLRTFYGFSSKKIIEVSISHNNYNYLIIYYFKGCINSNTSIYKQFYYYLRKREREN